MTRSLRYTILLFQSLLLAACLSATGQDKAPIERVYRPADNRIPHDLPRLRQFGIDGYASKRLVLLTDIPSEQAHELPALVNHIYDDWVEYFGPLPPNREGTDYQITGSIIGDKDRFRAAGVMPDGLPRFDHGRHRGAEFWMFDQQFDYYRRHLLLHEATHCFMTTMPGRPPPVWYLEGMAEYFAGHHIDEQGEATFRVLPDRAESYVGFDRIGVLQKEIAAGRMRQIADVTNFKERDFVGSTVPYAWSWALCLFLDQHPAYQERFRQLGQHLTGSRFYKLLEQSFAEDRQQLELEWSLFARNLQYGYQLAQTPIHFDQGAPLSRVNEQQTCVVQADQGWQASGVQVDQGTSYHIVAKGRVTVAHEPKPWQAEQAGVSIRHVAGRPIGRLLGAVQGAEPLLQPVRTG